MTECEVCGKLVENGAMHAHHIFHHAQAEPPQGTYKGSEQYLDKDDNNQMVTLLELLFGSKPVTVLELLKAVEDLRTHLRRKYFSG